MLKTIKKLDGIKSLTIEETRELIKKMFGNIEKQTGVVIISDESQIKPYIVKFRRLKPISYGEEIVKATNKWNAHDIFMNSHQYCDVVDIKEC